MMKKQTTPQQSGDHKNKNCDEDVPVMVFSHIIIRDSQSGEVLVNKRA